MICSGGSIKWEVHLLGSFKDDGGDKAITERLMIKYLEYFQVYKAMVELKSVTLPAASQPIPDKSFC